MSDQPPRTDQAPRKLKRSSSDRVLSGVCGGLGGYFSVDPLILRIAFAVSIFFGGLGVVLYLALAALVPVDDAPDGKPLISLDRSSAVTVVIALAVLVVAIPILGVVFAWVGDPAILWFIAAVVLVIAGITAWRERSGKERADDATAEFGEESPSPELTPERTTEIAPHERPSSSSAPTAVTSTGVSTQNRGPVVRDVRDPERRRSNLVTVLLVCGTALLSAAAFFAAALTVGFGLGPLVAAMVVAGGLAVFALAFAVGRGARWLIVPLLAMVLGAGAAEAADLDLEGGVGERTHRPQLAASIPAEGYRLGVGHLVVDLRELAWRRGTVVPVRASAGAGLVEIVVPPDVCVVGEATTRAGYIALAGEEESGLDTVVHGIDRELLTLSDTAREVEGKGRKAGAPGGGRAGGSRMPAMVEVDASVDFGAVFVRNDGNYYDGDDSGRLAEQSLAEMRRLNERACAG